MLFINKLYVLLGNVAYVFLLPVMRLLIKRTTRAYLIIESGGDILMVKNWLSRPDWTLPGGGLGKNEEPQKAIAREVREELGIDLGTTKMELVAEGRWQSDGLGHRYYIFAVRMPTQAGPKRRKLEIIDARWVPLGSIRECVVRRELLDAIESPAFTGKL